VRLRHEALILGLGDFVKKCGFGRVHLGLSGGIDSAVVAALAAKALGSENVTTFAMPGPFSAPKSLSLAQDLADNLKVRLHVVPISPTYEAILRSLSEAEGDLPFGVMHENLQARIRGMVLMAYANRERSLLIATSNKSELATGYSTLYGDMCGALMPIGDLVKREVYELAQALNSERVVIPQAIIDRAPSAELRPGQTDEASLMPYSILDTAVEKLVEGYQSAKSESEKRVLGLMMASEFKRWQAPPILKVSDHAFGRGRRVPLAHRALL
jgi:NAD+ synthase (glutamine-hydrolysing)